MDSYYSRTYEAVTTVESDTLRVYKTLSNWLTISLSTGDRPLGEVTLRSEEMVYQLRYLLGRVLGQCE